MKKYWFLLLISTLSIVSCSKDMGKQSTVQIYYFDVMNKEFSKESLIDNDLSSYTKLQQIEYIISKLNNNHNEAQSDMKVPIKSYQLQGRIAKIDLSKVYYDLPPDQKIGFRVAVVYTLTELPFIDGIEFTVEGLPLTTAMGKPVGIIYKNDIKVETLEPNPATKTYVLNVYFTNKEGKLVKEIHSITGSNSSKEEKLILEELIQGPKSNDLMPTLPKNTKINTVDTLNGVCQVDLSFDFKTKTQFFKEDRTRYLMIYSIVNSLTELPKIKKVIISIDGKENCTFGSIELPKTFERSEAYVSEEKDTT